MKKLFIAVALLASLVFATIAPATASCWNVISERAMAPGVVHQWVDRDCDWVADIIQEYQWNGYRWVKTRWWSL